MRTVVIIQARMGSTRLPGKVMRQLCGQTVLSHVVARVAAAGHVDQIVVATTEDPRDEVICLEAEKLGVASFRGSEDDVLARYYQAAVRHRAEAVVRITSDCPLLDPAVLGRMLGTFIGARGCDYLSNTVVRSYPRGLDAEVFTFEALAQAYDLAQSPHEREHVTPYLYNHPERFSLQHDVRAGENLADLRWTLDTEEDWSLIDAIYRALNQDGQIFSTDAVLGLLQARPELSLLNAHVEQKKVGI